MREDQLDDTQPLASESIGANHNHASSSSGSSNGDIHHRACQETLRRESVPIEPLDLPKSHKLAPIQIVSQTGPSSHNANGNAARIAVEQDEASGSRSQSNSPVPSTRSRRTRESSVDDDEDVWEDEEDSILMDEHGNVIYEGPNYEDSASDFSDDGDHEESSQHRRAYREATQQYRKSRRALLLSGMSSFASSPSSDDLSPTPTMRQQTSASPSSSIFDPGSPPPEHESYYQPHSAEAVDTADTSGRVNGIEYDFDSANETKAELDSPNGRHLSPITVKLEEQDDHKFSYDNQSPQTPKALNFASTSLESKMGKSPRLTVSGPDDEGFARPPHASRGPSFLTEAVPSTPIRATGPGEPRSAASGDGHSQQSLAPSPMIFDGEHELTEAYMTPRLSISMLHDEQKLNPPPFNLPEPIAEAGSKQERDHKANGAAVTIRSDKAPFSLWDYLKEEVLATDFDATQEMKWERVTNFISIPFWMEKIIMFGFVVCLDSFLYTFTILPLRFFVAVWTWIGNTARWILGGQRRYLHASHKCDILKMLLIVLSCWILSRITDASKMYHSVRGQDVVKLSVIFNVLEIADRLCCSFGQDLLDSLFSRSTLARRKNGRQPYLRPVGFFCLSLAYVLAHTLVLFYQLVTLNVAINSYDNALLTLLLSNQFVEIKSSVFKKFEKENVFQMTCADIVERFQLTLMLSAIGLRNLIELSGGSLEPSSSPLPASFTVFPSLSLLETVLTPVCIVLASECIVDWLKHAFITKFNHIRPAVYGRFMDVLCRDLVVGAPGIKENSRKHTFVDQSPIISRRLGFAALPLACLLVRLILQIIGMIGDTSHIDECIAPISPRISESSWIGTVARKLGAVDIDNEWVRALDLFVRGSAWALLAVIAWGFLVAIKLLLGTNLVSFASHRYATMHERENEENLNARDRAPIGTNKDERSYDKSLGKFIDRPDDDAVQIKLDGTHILPVGKEKKEKGDAGGGGGGKAKKETSLMEVSRYNMVRSRIW